MNFLALFVLSMLFCFKAKAAYECHLNLSHAETADIVLVEKTIKVKDTEMRQKNEGMLLEESLNDKIALKTFMSGWGGEEEAVVEIFRDKNLISEKYQFRGNEDKTVWFDSYKLDVNCSIK